MGEVLKYWKVMMILDLGFSVAKDKFFHGKIRKCCNNKYG